MLAIKNTWKSLGLVVQTWNLKYKVGWNRRIVDWIGISHDQAQSISKAEA